MRVTDCIYKLTPSIEEDRPVIDFLDPECKATDWLRVDEVLRGLRPITDYQVVRIPSPDPGGKWQCFSVPGTFGLFSSAAVELIGALPFRLFDLLPAYLGIHEFFFVRAKEKLFCLDRGRSVVVTFQSDPAQIKEIKEYVFKKDLIDDSIVFTIPEYPGLFVTEPIRQKVIERQLSGFLFQKVN